jgi:phage shock protein PspC (stress-responsive transcriptional regulator)
MDPKLLELIAIFLVGFTGSMVFLYFVLKKL